MRQIILLSCAALLLIVTPEIAQGAVVVEEDADTVARASLVTLGKLVTSRNCTAMGFETPEEVEEAELGEPLEELMIGLDSLQSYAPGTDPEALLFSVSQMFYPVLVHQEVRSSITLARVEGEWKAVAYGDSHVAKLLAAARAGLAEVPAPFIVRVPALNLYFLGHRDASGLMLTPVHESMGFGFETAMPLPAAEVLGALVPAAQAYEDEPG